MMEMSRGDLRRCFMTGLPFLSECMKYFNSTWVGLMIFTTRPRLHISLSIGLSLWRKSTVSPTCTGSSFFHFVGLGMRWWMRDANILYHAFRPRISKIYFKGKYFMLRVRDKNVSLLFLFLLLSFVG